MRAADKRIESNMYQLTVFERKKRSHIFFETPATLYDLMKKNVPGFQAPCAGHGRCGKCKVQAYGALSPLSGEEKKLLSAEEQMDNMRLACMATALGTCSVHLVPHTEIPVQKNAPSSPDYGGGYSYFGRDGFAAAVDIGTTTIAAYLVSLTEPGKPPAYLGAYNRLSIYGADVISRIAAAAEEGVPVLQDILLDQIEQLVLRLLAHKNIRPDQLKGICLAGNTTMLHLAGGLDPSGLGEYPFVPQSLFGVMYESKKLFRAFSCAMPVYFAPCIDAFIGADTVCALLCTKLLPGDLLVDIGTNGEMAVAAEHGIICCSVAAGPAFEGAGLSMGMPAQGGAIHHVFLQGKAVRYTIAQDKKAKGICGSGAVSALAMMQKIGALDETGRLDSQYAGTFPIGDSGVVLTQHDIRQLQLAKAAVCAGIESLLHHCGCSPQEAGTLYIAGVFGNSLDYDAAIEIGLFPQQFRGKIKGIGNAAGTGLCLCAGSEKMMQQAQELSQQITAVSLSTDSFFQQRYIDRMAFSSGLSE